MAFESIKIEISGDNHHVFETLFNTHGWTNVVEGLGLEDLLMLAIFQNGCCCDVE